VRPAVPGISRRLAAGSSAIVLAALAGAPAGLSGAPQAGPGRIRVLGVEPATGLVTFGKFEISAAVDTRAENLLWPYDAAPPKGVARGAGVSVYAEFSDPDGRIFAQPAFFFERYEQAVRNGRDWRYPTGERSWRVRFSPNRAGRWKYRLAVEDQQGHETTSWESIEVAPSDARGFIRVSRADRRYFEYEDGTFFTGLGFELPEHLSAPLTRGVPMYRTIGRFGATFGRLWIGTLYGSAWTPWTGGRNRYNGYLPLAGLEPFTRPGDRPGLAMRLDYEPAGDTGWFDACRLRWSDDLEAVKPRTTYRVGVSYTGRRITGPRNPRAANYGLVLKVGGMFPACHEPGTSRPLTGYGREMDRASTITGTWTSDENHFLPRLHLALENVSAGAAYVTGVSVREVRADGTLGPEVLERPSMQFHEYVPQGRAAALDTIVDAAASSGVALKLVLMEKGDEIYSKLGDDGAWVTDRDNPDGVYGTGRVVNRTRWLQQAWWRYAQARWGYSPAVHSWELVNEGDPSSERHYAAADELGRYMHYGVFGKAPSPGYDHPNDHLVTTSFWHSFPATAFWASEKYAHVDYADVHAYVSTSFAPVGEKQKMMHDAAYYHTWHSQAVAAARLGKPVVRGEAGLDAPGRQDERALGLERDTRGVWLHNFLWAGLDSGGLYELYWWRSHIWGRQGDLRSAYHLVHEFLSELDLNKGGYTDWAGSVSTPALRVVGQKHVKSGRLHLWIQNTGHTWKAVVGREAVEPVSGTVRVPGFAPSARFDVEWWDTWAATRSVRTDTVTSDASGVITLDVPSLATDVAVSISQISSKQARPGRNTEQ
jgi:hypothetical protein